MTWDVIVILLAFLLLVFFISLQLLFYYERSEEILFSQALAAKITALVGFELIWLLSTLLPTDAISTNTSAYINMEIFWSITLIFLLLYMIFAAPLAIKFYEADTDPRITLIPPWRQALTSAGVFAGCVIALYTAAYFAFRRTEHYVCDTNLVCHWENTKTPFFLFSAVFVGFFGWFLVVFCFGIGLVSVPHGLIAGFIYRPQPISEDDYREGKSKLASEVSALKLAGEEMRDRFKNIHSMKRGCLKWRAEQSFQSDLNRFKQSVYLIEKDFRALEIGLKKRGENPAIAYFKLGAGVLSAIFSLCFYIHIILYILVGQFLKRAENWGFINLMFEAIAGVGFYGLDMLFYQVFISYLVICLVNGCFQMTLRLFACFSIHPMKKGETYMNSILFNISLVMVAAHGLTHLAYLSLSGYLEGTFTHKIYNEYALHTVFLGKIYEYNIFVYLLCIWVLIVLVYLCIMPKQKIAFDSKRIEGMIATTSKNTKRGTDEKRGSKEGSSGLVNDMEDDVGKTAAKAEKIVKFLV